MTSSRCYSAPFKCAESAKSVMAAVEDQAATAEISSDDPSSMDAEALPGYLPWEKDLEMVSNFLDRKEELVDSHKQYIKDNPELKAILADFLQALLIQRPSNVYEFARKFFTPFDPQAPHAPSYPSYKPQTDSK